MGARNFTSAPKFHENGGGLASNFTFLDKIFQPEKNCPTVCQQTKIGDGRG